MNATAAPASVPVPTRYTPVAMALHWILALGIAGAFVMGLVVEDMPFSPTKLKYINWHKWAGICILALTVLRLLWRFTHRPPALPPEIARAMPGWQHVVHLGTQHLMYLLSLVVPLLGWAYSSAKGFPIVLFGVLPLPDLLPLNKELAESIKPLHALAAFSLIGLAGLHVAAALKHQFIDKDGLLQRMRPGR
jgi:cytochrome b561